MKINIGVEGKKRSTISKPMLDIMILKFKQSIQIIKII